MAKLILLNKPYQVLSQFSDSEGRDTLAKFVSQKNVYPAGRLDYDSEGLIALTDNGQLQHYIANPKKKMPKTYWAQVEGVPDENAFALLRKGVILKDGKTKPAKVKLIDEPRMLWPRVPPIRVRESITTQWILITIREGKNRQVRRMFAAIGSPVLRLIRYSIGVWDLDGLKPGESRVVNINLPNMK